jgi:membrane protein required for colicin V production
MADITNTVQPVLTVIDGLLLLVLIISALMGMARGFTREIAGFASLAAATTASIFLARPVAPLLMIFDFRPVAEKIHLTPESVAMYVAGAIVFLVAWVLAWFMGESIARRVQSMPAINSLDRVLGFMYGGGRGLLVAVAVFLVYTLAVGRASYPQTLADARLLPVLEGTANVVLGMTPPDVRNAFNRTASPNMPAVPLPNAVTVPQINNVLGIIQKSGVPLPAPTQVP